MPLTTTVHSIDYSADGRRIAIGGGDDANAVTIWDVATQQQLMTLATPGYSFRQVEFSPDGNSIMAIGGSRSLNVLHAPTIETIDAIQHQSR